VVDTCVGNDKDLSAVAAWHQRQGPFLSEFEASGFPRDSIDIVLCTHLHVDHVGWNTVLEDGKWQPTFPKARYLFADTEWNFWKTQDEGFNGTVLQQSVHPIWDAGLADLVDDSHQVCEAVRLEPTPGHTPGHVSVRISSRGEEAVITGDMIHHPCQIAEPSWGSHADSDFDQAITTRKRFLERYAGGEVLVIGTHFASPTAGRVMRDGKTYRFDV
jgi:glyoxylase-like metal-dependent hydrolase (beta-lactamase superfamily II)